MKKIPFYVLSARGPDVSEFVEKEEKIPLKKPQTLKSCKCSSYPCRIQH